MIKKRQFLHHIIESLVETPASQKFYLFCQTIICLQTILYLENPLSIIHTLIKWSDASNFLQPPKSIICSFILITLFMILMVGKILFIQVKVLTERPYFVKIYLNRLISYLQIIISSLILTPLIRSTYIAFMENGASSFFYLGLISTILALTIIYPMHLICQSSRLALTSYQGKLTPLNLQFYFNLLRIIIPVASVLDENLLIFVLPFLILYIYFTWSLPVISYKHNNSIQLMMSGIAFTCLCKLYDLIDPQSPENFLFQVLGIISFSFMVSSLRSYRIRKILAQQEFSVKKMKILLFLIDNIEQNWGILSAYLLEHHKKCQQVVCHCQNVKNAQYSKKQLNYEQLQKQWYELLANLIQNQFNMQKLEYFCQSDKREKIKMYNQFALNLSQIYLFKLEQINKSYFIFGEYLSICRASNQNSFMSRLEVFTLKFYFQEMMKNKTIKEGKISSKAEQYIRFQICLEQLKQMMRYSCQSISQFWEQTLKQEPDQSKIIDIVHSVFEWNQKIEKAHKNMLVTFENCSYIIGKSFNLYYIHLFNISNDSLFHFNKNFTFEKEGTRKMQKNETISENPQIFTFGSQIPICFISVDKLNFGEIIRYNQFFAKSMKVEDSHGLKIQDLLIPQMRRSHEKKMKCYLEDDYYKLDHNKGITFNKDGYLMFHRILVQSFPSIENGLQYVVLFKQSIQKKKIFAVKNKQNIIYISEQIVKSCGGQYHKLIKKGLKNSSFYDQLVEKKQSKIKINQNEEKLLLLSQFKENQNNWLILEIQNLEANQMYSKSTISQASQFQQQAERAFKFVSIYKQECSKDKQIQNSSTPKISNNKNTAKQNVKLQGEQQAEQKINESFENLTSSSQKGIIIRTKGLYILVVIILLGIIISSAQLKSENIKSYQKLADTNRAYHKLMLNLNGVTIYSRIITFFTFLDINTYSFQIMFAFFSSFSGIIPSLDDLVKNFNIEEITEDWAAFSCNKNQGIITGTNQNNLHSIADHIQNPVTNLISVRDYKFSMDKNSSTKPFTNTQCYYFQLVLNSQYSTIPNLRKLKKNLNNILINSVQINSHLIFVFSLALTVLLLFIFLVQKSRGTILSVKYAVYDIYEKTDYLFRRSKLQKCKYYLTKNQVPSTISRNIGDYKKLISSNEDEPSSFASSLTQQNSIIFQKGLVNTQFDQQQQKLKQGETKLQKYTYLSKLKDLTIIKSILFTLPIAFCFLSFYYLEYKEVRDVKNALMIQDKLQIMQQNYNFIKLYAMQYVFEQSSFQKYLNSRDYVNVLSLEIFQIQRNFVDKSEDLTLLPNLALLIDQMAFNNLCNSTFFQLNIIPNMCPIVGGGILTKGLYSSLINYLEQSKDLINLHPDVHNYTLPQKLQYLSSPFFNDGVITVFIDQIFRLLLESFSSDFKGISQKKLNQLIIILIALGTYILVFGIVACISTINQMNKHLEETKTISILISLQSLRKNDNLKQLFSNSLEKFDKLN